MQEQLAIALDLADANGASYADARVVQHRGQDIAVRNGELELLEDTEELGLGVRTLVDGAWGFASTHDLSREAIQSTTQRALAIASASSLAPGDSVQLGPPITSQGSYVTPVEVDPFDIPLERKLAVLMAADEGMSREAQVRSRQGNLVFIKERKWFANSEGARTDQTIIETGGGIMAVASGEGEIQQRSHPASFGRQQLTAGWEAVERWQLAENAERVAAEAAALLTAERCPSGIYDLILGGDQVALQIHESCGHPIELDRVYGTEAAYAGTSFLTPEKLDNFMYGSEVVNITAESVRAGGLGTFGWDDEGVPAQSTPVVQHGRFVGYLMSRETASRLGRPSNGCMRASSWNRIPLIRMTNVSLEPGNWDLDDLIADTERGIYMETNRSWSIDDRRYNFQFGTEIGYEIVNGKRGRLLRNPTYTGITPEFWNSCDAVCSQSHWTMWGTPNCGKGQPAQIAHTGHGAAPARFRGVQVGILQ